MLSLKNDKYANENQRSLRKTSPINFRLLNMMLQKKQQKKQRFKSHSLTKKNPLVKEISQDSSLSTIIKRKSLTIFQERSQNIGFLPKSSEKQNNRKLYQIQKIKKVDKPRGNHPPQFVRNETKKLSLNPKNSSQKHHFTKTECSCLRKNNLNNQDKLQNQFPNFTENIQISGIRKKENHISLLQILGINTYKMTEFEKFGKNKSHQRQIVSTKQISQKLDMASKVIEISIEPWTKCEKRANVQVQTIQNEKQYFEYWVYKRKKDQYEEKLKQLFYQVQMVRQDRQKIEERSTQILDIYKQQPHDDREKRIFELKRALHQQQQKIENLINEKYQKEDTQLRQIQQIEIVILSGLNKLDEMLKNHFLLLNQVFENNQNPKCQRIVQRIRSLISHVLSEVTKQINYQIKKGKNYKYQSHNLRQAFNQFIDSNNQFKRLLKNCFEHLKKPPQLCYELLGIVSQQNADIQNVKIQYNEFQKPKCVNCFNTHWKLNTVSEQNILMKSVLKVTSELLK